MGIILVVIFMSFFLSISSGDDAAVMGKITANLSSPPPDWKGSSVCSWTGVKCDKSGRITSIRLSSHGVSGTLSSEIKELTHLETLALQGNSLSGTLPSLSNLPSLREIYLDSNNFTTLPSGFLQGLSNLQTLSLNQNMNLSPWTFPAELSQSSSLITFSASNANIHGTIPDIFSSLPNLQNLRLSYNNLTGMLPLSLAGSAIQNLLLNNQIEGLSGRIDVLANMTHLSQAWLHKNSFIGPIPDLSQCKSLFDLQLRDNQFTGLVPSSLISLPSLSNLTLQNNKFQGSIPVFGKNVYAELGNTNAFCRTDPGPCDPQVSVLLEVSESLGYPMVLAQSWEGNNACKGWGFVTCDQQENIVSVNFGKKGFTGRISPAFSNLTSLRNLYLNDNNLTGMIPDILCGLNQLQVLDVSNNNLSGNIPIFPSRVKFIAGGNALLGLDVEDSSGASSGNKSGHGSLYLKVWEVIAIVLFTGVTAFVSYRFHMRKLLKSSPTMDKIAINMVVPNDVPVFEGGNVAISIQVLREVTENFSEENILGRGGFGVVYKGELHDGTRIAVKRMESVLMGSKGMNEFQAEIGVLTKVRHRHLVGLLGFCVDGNERLLVYEFMPKGSLAQHLFCWRDLGLSPLTWKQRVTIALDVARGVEYLHSLAQQSFIHRDLKPSNILLGDDMRAKVADFGLVKNAPDGKYSMETQLAGTFGYLAPEYATTGRVTMRVDVYAFGVILMELITGRKALDGDMPDDKSHLVSWFRRVLVNNEGIRNAIDENLEVDDSTYQSIMKVSELAGHCTARDPFQRPDMGHVVNVLSPLVQQWKPAGQDDENIGIDLHMSLPEMLERWQTNDGASTICDGTPSIPS